MPFPPTHCRLIVDPPGTGAWNMAVDEVLLDWAARHEDCCWRFYEWSEPTLSLGYFQSFAERSGHAASLALPVVRRLTGGGAIGHDRELTYSLGVPAGHGLAGGRDRRYEFVHTALLAALEQVGIVARLAGTARAEPQAGEPFLCFLRRSPGDVLIGTTKIAGSAQRRRRGAVLQHGSVLLGRSVGAPELLGLEAAGQPVQSRQLAAAWQSVLAPRLGFQWRAGCLAPDERQQAMDLIESRYGRPEWNQRGKLPAPRPEQPG